MDEIKLMTYNVWFSPSGQQDRRGAIYTIIKEHKPDIIAFQEMTPGFYRHLRRQQLGEDLDYYISDNTLRGVSVDPYGVLMLSRHPSSQFAMAELPSNMHRNLILTRLVLDSVEFVAASVHLESLRENTQLRMEQLRLIFEFLDQFDNAVLMGDMNLCSTWPENKIIAESNYVDLWDHLRPDEYGWTMNRDINPYLKNSRYPNARFDRILIKSKNWEANSIEIIGDKPVDPGIPGDPVFPSDHLGLVATITKK